MNGNLGTKLITNVLTGSEYLKVLYNRLT